MNRVWKAGRTHAKPSIHEDSADVPGTHSRGHDSDNDLSCSAKWGCNLDVGSGPIWTSKYLEKRPVDTFLWNEGHHAEYFRGSGRSMQELRHIFSVVQKGLDPIQGLWGGPTM